MVEDDEAAGGGRYVLDDQVGYLLRQVSQRHAAIFQRNVPHSLTPTQFSTLVRLHENGPTSQNELGRTTSMDVATIKGVIDRLKAKDFVGLKPYPGDKRRTLISLTETSAAMMEGLHGDGHRVTAETLAPLDGAERVHLIELLRRLV